MAEGACLVYSRRVDSVAAFPRRAEYVTKPEGGFQMLANLKDTYPYCANLIANIIVITTCGYLFSPSSSRWPSILRDIYFKPDLNFGIDFSGWDL